MYSDLLTTNLLYNILSYTDVLMGYHSDIIRPLMKPNTFEVYVSKYTYISYIRDVTKPKHGHAKCQRAYRFSVTDTNIIIIMIWLLITTAWCTHYYTTTIALQPPSTNEENKSRFFRHRVLKTKLILRWLMKECRDVGM